MQKKAFAGEILSVTFTNKAAREMSERVRTLTGVSQAMWMGTFHSMGAKILRRHAEMLGFTSSFVILDDDDQARLLKQILSDFNIDEKSMPVKLVRGVIAYFKDQGLAPDKVSNAVDKGKLDGQAVRIYSEYQARLKRAGAMDFGDLLLHCLTLFSEHPQVLEQYAKRFKYILVDEYQDTNIAQYLWLRLLALGHGNICCVGDDDQSIYSWRGAEVGNILKFEKDYPDAKIVRLECNYRSTGHILAAASSLIAKNQGRLGKTLWTPGEQGEKIRIKSLWDDREEASFVADEIEALQREKMSLDQVAILVRAGFQTRAFEERFLSMGIGYRVIGGLRFYERAEIRDAVAYLRVISQKDDTLAYERIINTPKRGIGQATLQNIHTLGRERNISLYRATEAMLAEGALKGKIGNALSVLMAQFERWREASKTTPLGELTEKMLDESGYIAMWQQEKTIEAQGRLENLRELVRALGEFETLGDFLEHVSLVMDNEANKTGEMVSLMTLHAAKGLEFDAVFMPGMEEGLFPHQRALDESGTKGLEEERRLAYVGITRARKRLWLTHAANRRIYNQYQSSVPSRFIGEIPAEHAEQLSGGSYQQLTSNIAERAKVLMNSNHSSAHFTHKTDSKSGGMVAVGGGNTSNKNARVFHQKFGYGRIIAQSGDHLTIRFDKAGEKKVMSGFVEIVS
jgi:DNA helicase-2/ATP-dependent DNA helicase PcrA